jgi:hypothetical protein
MSYLIPTKLIKYIINNTGETSVKGKLVEMDTTTNQVVLTTLQSDVCIGVIDEAGIANGATMRIVTGGETEVLLNDNVGCTAGDWAATGEAGGYARVSASPIAAPVHFDEVGHYTETVAAGGAGTHVLAKLIMHFN